MNLRVPVLLCCSLLLGGCQLFSSTPAQPSMRVQGELAWVNNQWQLSDCQAEQTLQIDFPAQWQSALTSCPQEQGASCFIDLAINHNTNNHAQVSHIYRAHSEGRGCNDDEFAHLQIRAFWQRTFLEYTPEHSGACHAATRPASNCLTLH